MVIAGVACPSRATRSILSVVACSHGGAVVTSSKFKPSSLSLVAMEDPPSRSSQAKSRGKNLGLNQ
ncbi:hypothetical protein ACJRO7_017437 [Eucalyptus globulus]|uniref:Uncharacterized protein n=1 Tax=Eucalyptus globulus TaxID=34317 RepID=A0ABD3KX92_EUCGL